MPPRRRRRTVAKVSTLPSGRDPNFELEAALDELPEQFIQCRDMLHAWRSFDAKWVDGIGGGFYEESLKCTRCKTVRTRLITKDGYLLRSTYEHPEGYLLKGMGRATVDDRAAMRLTKVTRQIDSKSTRTRKAG